MVRLRSVVEEANMQLDIEMPAGSGRRSYQNAELLGLLPEVDFGVSIAEQDNLLETARVETSAFSDILNDKVDLIPGTKGSGKSALYRIIVEFLADFLLHQKRAVVAHGVSRPGNPVFQAFRKEFEELDENAFVDFWCIYIVSLVHEQFLKNERYEALLSGCGSEVDAFRKACFKARIPEIKSRKSLWDILAWGLRALKVFHPELKYKPPGEAGEYSVTLFGPSEVGGHGTKSTESTSLPQFVEELRVSLEAILAKADVSVWFMIDKLDEIFLRRSELERRALRALLRTTRLFSSDRVRVKIFLRDDMLNEIVGDGKGFTALTHATARKADTLKWSEDQILTVIVKRFFASPLLRQYCRVDREEMDASLEYRREVFYRVFPETVHKGEHQSRTLRWIFNHTADGNGVVTPRDVIDLLTKAKQFQQNLLHNNSSGHSDSIIGSQAIQYGLEELSKHKRSTYLQAEFPHLWNHIQKFENGKTEYSDKALRRLLGDGWKEVVQDLCSIGLMSSGTAGGAPVFTIPALYRKGLKLTQGRSS
jgi:hypothetical protein